ncbi:MAG: 2-amino-4-hydroxy-6-hydroxymethyldihydropteridine diphosphokinase [bacterium]|nr:2-amino-4-hydroxy-6-hydroxymethyldihydropteridine diphosphokinase [bacterium]
MDLYLGIGSNQGDRLAHLQKFVSWVQENPLLQLLKTSSVYETEYVGPGEQDDYLNACLCLRSEVPLLRLMAEFQDQERAAGRRPDGHMKPRPLDVDILLADDEVFFQGDLEVPHPRLHQRLFVLLPLKEIAPEKNIPNLGETVAKLCAKIKRKEAESVRLCLGMKLGMKQESEIAGRITEE